MLLIALLLAGQQVATQPAPADVVIVGNRMRDALDKCLARNCPPEEEVDAAMNAGAESFSAGRYEEAKQILRRSISRNKQYGARMPAQMSDLYATYADVTEHEGDDKAFRHATRESVDVLRRHLGRTHAAAIRASPRIGDMWVKLGRAEVADNAYRDAAEDAARAGNKRLAGALTFRRAWVATSAGNHGLARRLLDRMAEINGDDPELQFAGRVLRARIALAEDKADAADTLLEALRDNGGAEPILVKAPPYPLFDSRGSGVPRDGEGQVDIASARAMTLLDRSDIRWADIGFWVRPDGRTSDIEILRPAKGSQWARPLIKQIAGRRYAAASSNAEGLGTYRIERFTLRPSYGLPIGSHIQRRTGPARLHVIDLTQLALRDAAPPAAATAP